MAKKKTASKPAKPAAAKVVKKPAPAKKPAAAKKPEVKKASAKAPAKKTSAPAAPKSVPSAHGKLPVRPSPKPPPVKMVAIDPDAPVKIKPRKLSAKEKKYYTDLLKQFRDRVVDDITFLAGDNLNRNAKETAGDLSSYSYHMADQGTDNFDREFALNRVSSEQDILYEIDEALARIDQGTYGICELTGQFIEEARLKAMPHTRYSLAAQAQMEKSRTRYRPFGPTIHQTERF